MRSTLAAAAAAIAITTIPSLVVAQSSSSSSAPRQLPPQEIYFYGTAGGLSPLTSLDAAGDSKFKTGYTFGGGIGWRILPILDVRGDFNYGEASIKDGSAQFAGDKFKKMYYGGEFVLRYPTRSGIAPFIGIGAGAVTVDPKSGNADAASTPSTTKFAGRSSVGIEFAIPKSHFSVLTQATGWLYKNSLGTEDKTQLDLQYNVGFSYRLPL